MEKQAGAQTDVGKHSPSFLLPHVAARLFDTPLAIERGKIRTIIAAIRPRLGIDIISMPMPPDQMDYQETEKRAPYQIVNGYGVIDVCGTLVYKASGLDAFSGLTSYEQLAADYAQALDDARVQAIAFRLHCYGGEVDGLFDFTDKVYAGRTKKRTLAIIDQKAFSAAYAIAAACSQIVIGQTGMAGSIGVVMERLDQTEANKQMGYVVYEIYEGERKVDTSPDVPLTDAARAALQATVRTFYDKFTAKVARYRGLAQARVEGTEAGIFVGEDAIRTGLADTIGTFESVIGAPAPEPEYETQQPAPYQVPNDDEEVDMKIDTIEALAKEYPDLCAKLTEQVTLGLKAEVEKLKSETLKAEQERVVGIYAAAGFIAPKTVAEAVAGGLSLVEAKAVFFDKKQEKTQANAAAWLNDAQDPAHVSPLPDPQSQLDPVQAQVNKALGISNETFVKYANGLPEKTL